MFFSRRVVQICAIPETDGNYCTVYALCDDGTIWAKVPRPDNGAEWMQVVGVPQPEITQDMIDRITQL